LPISRFRDTTRSSPPRQKNGSPHCFRKMTVRRRLNHLVQGQKHHRFEPPTYRSRRISHGWASRLGVQCLTRMSTFEDSFACLLLHQLDPSCRRSE
jgi:hypothetical protein